MTRWIADHAPSLDLKKLLHVGDVVNAGDTVEVQYRIAQQALNVIHEAEIPMLIAIGNHDYDNQVKIDRSSRLFNQYFGKSVYGNRPWFGWTFEEGKSENSYAKLDIGGSKFIFVSLEFGPRDTESISARTAIRCFNRFKTGKARRTEGRGAFESSSTSLPPNNCACRCSTRCRAAMKRKTDAK